MSNVQYASNVQPTEPPTIEVSAALGSSVLTVKHLTHPQLADGGGRARAYAALAAISLIAAVAAFVIAVRGAAYNAAGADEWVNKLGRPAYAFRPHMVGRQADAIALLGLLGGLGFAIAALAARRRDRQSPVFTIGSAPGVELATTAAPATSFCLVAPRGDEFVFSVAPGMTGDVVSRGVVTPFADEVRDIVIPRDGYIAAKLGTITYRATAVVRPQAQPVAWLASLDTSFLAYAGVTFFACFGLLGLLYQIAPPGEGIDADMGLDDAGLLSARADAKEDVKLDDADVPQPSDVADAGGSGAAMALASGQMGSKTSDRSEGRYKMAKTSEEQMIARQASEAAASGGAIGQAFAASGGAVFASLTGSGDATSGLDDIDIQGGLHGTVPGEMRGGFGFGPNGFEPGGGGNRWGTVGLDDNGRIGHNKGTGSEYTVGPGGGGSRRRASVAPEPSLGTPEVSGELDQATIRRYVKRNMEKIRSCYERQLLADPTLQGTVVVQFFIGPTGSVTSATARGLHGNVSTCLAEVVSHISFPRPGGGAGVHVKSYPFEFRPSGS
ncbi:MAG: AgmX/PglI C-terminal domain-containing protein [Myxococcales bacterium]|nr:AgmX/PglI C-terminal domain-containing protein [Myxococcales bacterium]